jgi:tetratricopeptide (TPR) repeat protein
MEGGKLANTPQVRETYFVEAEKVLLKAQRLNPLDTDHTANLGRLYRTWADYEEDPARRRARLETARDYYAKALLLSPNNAQIHNEAGLVHYLLGDTQQALAEYQRSLELDQEFMQTYVLLGDLYLAQEEWEKAAEAYEAATQLRPDLAQAWSALGYAYSQMGAWDQAIAANEQVLEMIGDDYSTLKNMAIIHREAGNLAQALFYAEQALSQAPEQERQTVEAFIASVSADLVKQGQ